MQVVDSTNHLQLIETGKVDEFKPPEKVEKTEAKEVVLRDDGGKFVAPQAQEPVDKPVEKEDKTTTSEKSDTTKAAQAEDDEDLPERVRRKIGAKHRQMKEAEEFAERQFNERAAERRRADGLQTRLDELEGKSKSGPPSGEPKPEDFKTVAEYADALVEFKFTQREEKAAREKSEREFAERKSAFSQRIAQAMKDIPDYEEVTSGADIEVPAHVAAYIEDSPLGPNLGYHLAKYPDEAARIAKLSPIRAIAELGKLEAKLEKPPEKAVTKVEPTVISKAPSPIAPLDGSGTTVVHKDPKDMNFQEYRIYEREQEAAKRRR